MAFSLFLDKDGKAQFDDKGTPLYVQGGGTDPVAMNVNEMIDTNRQKHGVAESARREKETALGELNAFKLQFDGIDPDGARKAMEIARSLDEEKLLEAGKVDELRQKFTAENQHKLDSLNKALAEAKEKSTEAVKQKEQTIHNLLVKNSFAESGYLRDKTVLPPDFAYNTFSKNFTVEYQDGIPVVIARDNSGNQILSASNPGVPANPEEAIKFLIEEHPQKDALLRNATPNGGSGTKPGSSGGGTITSLKQLKTSADRSSFIAEHGLDAFKNLSAE